mmetsp:Transcript_20138/g.46326  ORF Transcript_20138/g.46326 Transcript_20138/m.46326 type:complete len:232 (-) Transcript_20138:177-872(-)
MPLPLVYTVGPEALSFTLATVFNTSDKLLEGGAAEVMGAIVVAGAAVVAGGAWGALVPCSFIGIAVVAAIGVSAAPVVAAMPVVIMSISAISVVILAMPVGCGAGGAVVPAAIPVVPAAWPVVAAAALVAAGIGVVPAAMAVVAAAASVPASMPVVGAPVAIVVVAAMAAARVVASAAGGAVAPDCASYHGLNSLGSSMLSLFTSRESKIFSKGAIRFDCAFCSNAAAISA